MVCTQLEEEGDEANGARRRRTDASANHGLEEADHPMKPAEIVALALEKHGREMPSGTLNGNLHRWKKEGRVINTIIGWSLTPPVSLQPAGG